jgi:PAS domain S-box-containing protein
MTKASRQWFWATLILSCLTIVMLVFSVWELMEKRFFRDVDFRTLHFLYISRGVVSSLVLAAWASWFVLRERRHHEEELRLSRERYRGILEGSPDAVALYDRDLMVIEWNLSAERLFGFSKEDVIGKILPNVPEQHRGEVRQYVARLSSQQKILDVETLRWNRAGEPIWVSVSLSSLQDEFSGQVHFLEVARDIREKIALRDKIIEVEKLTAMGQMAAGTAHHLNTPLASLLLRVQMMKERLRQADTADDLLHLEAGIHSCQVFVERLLRFSHRMPAQKKPEDLCHQIESMVTFLRPTFTRKRTHLIVDLDRVRGVRVMADRSQLEALFSALLVNATDAIAEEGTVTITALPMRAGGLETDHSAPADGDEVEICIIDDGCGVSEKDLPRLFEPFFTTKPPGQGTGLGLALAHTITREHGGSIMIQNRKAPGATSPAAGHGACVRLRFPLYKEASSSTTTPRSGR